MNAHHPRWGGIGTRADKEAGQLLEITDERDLELLTEEGKTTWSRNDQSSVIDLTFISSSLTSRLVRCERAEDIEHSSDHFPIRTVLDIETPVLTQQKRRNWNATDDKKLMQTIEQSLEASDLSEAGPPQIEAQCRTLLDIVHSAIGTSTPWAKPLVWSNPDFDDECKAAVKEVRRLRRKHTRTKDPYDWMIYSEARNKKSRLVKKALSKAHRRRVQQVIEDGPQGMWRLAKWARNRAGTYERGLTPSLKIQDLRSPGKLAETVDQKAEAFRMAFFPQPPPADLADTVSFQYPQPVEFPPITLQEIQDAVKTAKAGKAPGEDGIPNSLWHKLIEVSVILRMLGQLFNACVRVGYNPTHFQRSITVVLRKQGKSDYQLAKSYRPVALLNTLGKFLEATHLGGRRGISTDHAIHNMIDRIKTAWGKGKPVVPLLMLDVSGAYDTVSHDRLLHNLRKRRLGQLAPWVKAFLSNRSTRIRMPEGISHQIPTPTGIPQGSPISPILYLLYNADLIENCGNDITSNGWVDDVCFMAKGDSERETTKEITTACRKADQWARTHASVFDPKKYALVHFVNTRDSRDRPAIHAAISTGAYSNSDEDSRTLSRLLARPRTGIPSPPRKGSYEGRRISPSVTKLGGLDVGELIYQAVVIPQMLFGVSAWYQPMLISKTKARTISQPFAGIQKRAACLISGAFRTTAAEALNIAQPDSAACGQRHWDRTQMDPCASRKPSQQVFPPCGRGQTPNSQRSEAGVGQDVGQGNDQRPTKRLIEAPTKKTLEYWSGLRKATGSILMQLRTGRIGLGAYLNRINRRETARCGCDLGNQTVTHVLLECPLHQDERDWMRRALSNHGVALHRDELLTRPEARTVVAEFMVKTGLLGQFHEADLTALGVEEGDDKGAEISIP
ncbi:hypothetical protein DTO027I6_9898 [Penicillium roqueforti]|nr:hypothetical protein CBS147337_9994 [Penicillium roqueforti]KAI3184983.1 hypothetical protein DTO027I6_9898 [Penicillium roqueforti]